MVWICLDLAQESRHSPSGINNPPHIHSTIHNRCLFGIVSDRLQIYTLDAGVSGCIYFDCLGNTLKRRVCIREEKKQRKNRI